MPDEVKQVLVVNMAVPMTIGRLMAQVTHAAVLNVIDRGNWKDHTFTVDATNDPAYELWMAEQFTAVVCKAWGKEAMLKIKAQAEALGIHVSVMEEDGFITAIGIGPASIKNLEFTKGLALM